MKSTHITTTFANKIKLGKKFSVPDIQIEIILLAIFIFIYPIESGC